jgi:hypothetical protein
MSKTPHPTPHTPHPATTEKLFQQTLIIDYFNQEKIDCLLVLD